MDSSEWFTLTFIFVKMESQQLDTVYLIKPMRTIMDPFLFAAGANSVPLLDRIAEALRQQKHELTEADRVT